MSRSIDYIEVVSFLRTNEDGTFNVPANWTNEIRKFFPNQNIEIIARRKRSRRSADQNRYIHKLFRIFSVELIDYTGDKTYTPSLIKDLMKMRFLKYDVCNEDGEVIGQAVKGTSSLNKSEMSDFVAEIINYAFEQFKIKLPLPGEQTEAKL